MKIKKISPITASENSPYSIDEPWSTADREGFFVHDRTTTVEKLDMLRNQFKGVTPITTK